jgi:hypothetical protein
MRAAWSIALALVLAVVLGIQAEDKKADKPKTLKGTITCGKCDLKKDDACATVIVVKGKDDKETVYYFDTDGHKKYHKEICMEAKEGTVTGTVKKKGDKWIVTVKKVTFKE